MLKDIKEAPGLAINISIKDKNLSLVYEDKFIYGDYDGFKLKSDDGSIASIADAVLKIYDVDITPILEKLGIEEDEKDINSAGDGDCAGYPAVLYQPRWRIRRLGRSG